MNIIEELRKKVEEYRHITDHKKALESVKQNGHALQFVRIFDKETNQ